MRAIIEVDVPDHQIGQEANIYFKDTMMIKGIVQEPCGETASLEAFKQVMWERDIAIQQLHDLGYDFGEQIPAVQAVPIPQNATNGDVIKAMFPCLEKYEHEELYTHGIALAGNNNRAIWFTNDWWNAPYKGSDAK